MTEDTSGLKKVLAREIMVKINYGEPVEYDHVIIVGNIDISKLFRLHNKEGDKRIIQSLIKVTNSQIEGRIDFENIICEQQINFEYSQFDGPANFTRSVFLDNASFSGATFRGLAEFSGATFKRLAEFSGATFSEDVYFGGAILHGFADFLKAKFHDASFSEVTFNGDADFREVEFHGSTDFSLATFRGNVKFDFSEEDGRRLHGLPYAYYGKANLCRNENWLIGFRTNNEWNIAELQAFVTSVADIYNFFLVKQISEEKKINFSHALLNIEKYPVKNQLLKIYRIEMGSPGGFSFLGLPEIIEQIRRTLIWWFHERTLNEFERAEKCLEVVKRYLELRNLDNEDKCIDDLIKKICAGVKIFNELESEGKLEAITENFGYIPKKHIKFYGGKKLMDDTRMDNT